MRSKFYARKLSLQSKLLVVFSNFLLIYLLIESGSRSFLDEVKGFKVQLMAMEWKEEHSQEKFTVVDGSGKIELGKNQILNFYGIFLEVTISRMGTGTEHLGHMTSLNPRISHTVSLLKKV